MIEAVLFDIDGTLLDHDRAAAAAFGAVLERQAPGLGEERRAAALAEWQRLEELHYSEYLAGAIAVEEQRRRRAAGILGWLGAELGGPDALDRWFADFLDAYRAAWTAFDDVEPVLAQLESRGIGLGVITNAVAALQMVKLRALGLEQRLPVFIASSEVGCAKPAPEIFAAGCRALGLQAARVAYVGDRLDTDARGARDAGLLGVWVNRDPELEAAADVPTISDLSRLADHL